MDKTQMMPLYMFPTAVPCVDDEHSLLIDLAEELELHQARYLFRLKPEYVLRCVNEQTDLAAVAPATEIYNANRFERIGVVVSDFHMPQMNGLQFCQSMQPRGVRKIIVSNKLATQEALQALNAGILRGFIHKEDNDAHERLRQLVRCSLLEYFCEIAGTFQEAGEQANSALCDPAFLQWFRRFCRRFDVQEYYTLDAAGTFLLLTHGRNVLGLHVRTRSQLQQLAHKAAGLDCPHPIVHSFGRGESVVVPPDPAQQQLQKDLPWWHCLHAVSEVFVGGREHYYCTWSCGMFDVVPSKIMTCYQYQEKHPD